MAKAKATEGVILQSPINAFLVAFATATINSVARVLRLQDNDRKDADDIAANVLDHVAALLRALLMPGSTFPPFPSIPFESPSDLPLEGKREAEKQYLQTIYSDKRRGSARLWVEFAYEYIQQIGLTLTMLDADNSGLDDRIGVTLIYGAEVLRTLLEGGEMPDVPDQLKEVAA